MPPAARSPFYLRVSGLCLLVVLAAACQDRGPAVSRTPAVPKAAIAAPPESTAAGDPAEGLRIANRVGCTGCHGANGAGESLWEQAGDFKVRSANLTQKRELYDDGGLHALLAQGRTHDGHKPFGMPIFMLQRVSVRERTDIIAWVRALPAVDNPSLQPTWMSESVRRQVEDGSYPIDDHLPDPGVIAPSERPADSLALGEYLAMTSCTACHGRDLRGWGPDDPAPSLVVAKAYSAENFRRLMREGITASGQPSKTGFMTAVAKQRFAGLHDEEIAALKAWLDARAP